MQIIYLCSYIVYHFIICLSTPVFEKNALNSKRIFAWTETFVIAFTKLVLTIKKIRKHCKSNNKRRSVVKFEPIIFWIRMWEMKRLIITPEYTG